MRTYSPRSCYGLFLIRENNHPFEDAMPRRMGVYNELVQEFGARIRNFPQSPQLFWTELKKCLTTKDGHCLLTDAFDGRRMQIEGTRDRWVQLPPLHQCREWWCQHKFVDNWGKSITGSPGSMI